MTKKIDEVRCVQDLSPGERALPRRGETWVVSQVQGVGAALAEVSHLVRVADTVYAVAEFETPEKTIDRSHYPITGERAFVICPRSRPIRKPA